MRHIDVRQARSLLRTTSELELAGMPGRAIPLAVLDDTIRKVRRGWYAPAHELNDLWPESRHLVHVVAVATDMRGDAEVVAYASAGVVWKLPIYRTRLPRVHVMTDSKVRISSGPDVFRHVHRLDPSDVTSIDGILCTTLDRTVFDLVRTLSPEAALSVADAALALVALRGRVYDQQRAEQWRADMHRRLRDARGARGVVQARMIVEIADGRAQLPGESVTRLQLLRLGFRVIRLQVPVPAPGGGWYWLDLGLEEVNAWSEFDGKAKYLDEALRSGRSIQEVLLEEKKREDWIRGTTDRRFARVEDEHIQSPLLLGRRLAASASRRPGRPSVSSCPSERLTAERTA